MNKPFMETVQCSISTLSPVHIGCGEDYYPTNYVIDGGFLHHFGEEALLKSLNSTELDNLVKLANEADEDSIRKIQGDIYKKKDPLKNYATHTVPVSKELEKFYLSRIGKTSQHESGGKKVNNQLAIARHAFNPYSNTPYFAGSSIKGAIRTALLNAENDGRALPEKLTGNHPAKTSNRQLQENVLKYRDITDDPLRLLKISDANYQHPDALHGLEIRFAANRKNKVIKEGAITKVNNGIPILLECLPAYRHCSFSFHINFLTDEKLNYRWNIKQIAQTCNDFFLQHLLKELDLIQHPELNYVDNQWANGLKKLLAGELGNALKQNQAFLLRIGKYGGAESNTLNGVRHIKITQGKDKKTGKNNPDKYLSKTTTIWLAGDNKDQQRDLLPFGWVLVEIGNTKLTQTAQFLTSQAAADYQKQQQLQALSEQRTQFLAEEQKRRALKAQQEAEVIEKQRLQVEAQAVRTAQLAMMSAEQQIIFELTEAFAKDKNPDPNGTLRQALTRAIKQAENWSAVDKQVLLTIGNALCNVWGKPKKLKDQLKTLQG